MPPITPIKVRKGTKQEWIDANPVLLIGEPGAETDTGKMKFGNGASPWISLPYIGTGEGLPPGGEIGQILVKHSLEDFDAEWATASGNIDGGSASSVYTIDQIINGGGA